MSPTLQKEKQIEDKPTSSNWFDLPSEMREMIIDRMDPRTRCKFAQCSKMCEEEVKGSTNHLTIIRIVDSVHKDLYIGYNHSDYHYCLRFSGNLVNDESMTIVDYRSISPITEKPENYSKWTKYENGNPNEVRNKYIKEIIEKNKTSIRKVLIRDNHSTFSLANINIKCLRNLECIELLSKADSRDVIRIGFMSMDQIYRTKLVALPATKVTYEDIKRFKGSGYLVKSDDLKEEHIEKYLKMVKNGEMQRNPGFVSVTIKNNENFDGRRIAEGLDVMDYIEDNGLCYFSFRLNYQTVGRNGICQVCYSAHIISVICC